MKILKGIIVLFLAGIFLTGLTGCPKRGVALGVAAVGTVIGAVGAKVGMDAARGEMQAFRGREYLDLPEMRSDILEIVMDVGKELRYRVAGWDKERKIVTFEMTNSFAAKEFLGKFTKIILICHVKEDDRKLDMNIIVTGNYRTGTEETAVAFLENFKNKLLAAISR